MGSPMVIEDISNYRGVEVLAREGEKVAVVGPLEQSIGHSESI